MQSRRYGGAVQNPRNQPPRPWKPTSTSTLSFRHAEEAGYHLDAVGVRPQEGGSSTHTPAESNVVKNHLVDTCSHIFEHSMSLDRRSVSDRPEPKIPRIPHMVYLWRVDYAQLLLLNEMREGRGAREQKKRGTRIGSVLVHPFCFFCGLPLDDLLSRFRLRFRLRC